MTIAVYRGRKATTQQQKSTEANSFLYESTHMKKAKMTKLLTLKVYPFSLC